MFSRIEYVLEETRPTPPASCGFIFPLLERNRAVMRWT